jgi:hypothetical protein
MSQLCHTTHHLVPTSQPHDCLQSYYEEFIESQYMRSRARFLFVVKFSCMLHGPAHFNTGFVPLNNSNYAISSVLF